MGGKERQRVPEQSIGRSQRTGAGYAEKGHSCW
jgi:hypothetical protein